MSTIHQKILNLENSLAEIYDSIDQHIEIEQIDIVSFDNSQEQVSSLPEFQHNIDEFRKTILRYKEDKSFYDIEVRKLKEIISKAYEYIQAIGYDERIAGDHLRYEKPNVKIKLLLEQSILSTNSIISAEWGGQKVSGKFSKEGYLKINYKGEIIEFASLRKAVYHIWKIGLPTGQWEFWSADGLPLKTYLDKVNYEYKTSVSLAN